MVYCGGSKQTDTKDARKDEGMLALKIAAREVERVGWEEPVPLLHASYFEVIVILGFVVTVWLHEGVCCIYT